MITFIIIFIFLFLWVTPSSCQKNNDNIQITLSCELDSILDKHQLIEKTYGSSRLKITYENRTNEAVYFAKISNECKTETEIGIPHFQPAILFNPPQTSITSNDYSYDTLKVNMVLGSANWEITDMLTQYEESHVGHILNNDLYFYYDTVRNYPFLRHGEIVKHLTANQTDSLIGYDDYFVFLEPGEIRTDSFDISGLRYFGGHYYFIICEQPDSIVVDQKYDEGQKRWNLIKMPYPDSIEKYRLYTDPIESNVLSVDF